MAGGKRLKETLGKGFQSEPRCGEFRHRCAWHHQKSRTQIPHLVIQHDSAASSDLYSPAVGTALDHILSLGNDAAKAAQVIRKVTDSAHTEVLVPTRKSWGYASGHQSPSLGPLDAKWVQEPAHPQMMTRPQRNRQHPFILSLSTSCSSLSMKHS